MKGEKMKKPETNEEMTAFLETLNISERTNVHGMLIKQGWAKDDKEAEELMNACGWFITATSDDGWEPGIT